MKKICPICEVGILKERKETVYFSSSELEIKNFEFSECGHCDSFPVLPDQAKRNDGRIKRVKRSMRK